MAKSKNKKNKNLEKQTLVLKEVNYTLYLINHKVDIIMDYFDKLSNYNTLTHVASFAGGVIVTFFFFGVLMILKKWGL